MKWILVMMCINKLNDVSVFCEPLVHFENQQQCELVQKDINKHEKKDHYYCVPEEAKKWFR